MGDDLIECIEEDFHNTTYLQQFIKKWSKSDVPFAGRNDLGEHVLVSVNEDNVDVATIQKNNVMRHNTYWLDGTSEEWFEH